MEHCPGALEELGLVLEEEPEEAMPLERAAAGAFRMRSPSVREEAGEAMTAARALDQVPAVAGTSDRAKQCMPPSTGHQPEKDALGGWVLDRAVVRAEGRLDRGCLGQILLAAHTR
jgi:hypothetical protein